MQRSQRPGTGSLYRAAVWGAIVTPPSVWFYYWQAQPNAYTLGSPVFSAWLGAGISLLAYGLLLLLSHLTRHSILPRPWLLPFVVLPPIPLLFACLIFLIYPIAALFEGAILGALLLTLIFGPLLLWAVALAVPSLLIMKGWDDEQHAVSKAD